MEWSPAQSLQSPRWNEFDSACQIGGQDAPEILVRMKYAQAGIRVVGEAEIIVPEKFTVALFVGPARIFAMDTDPEGKHTNKIGEGRPYHKAVLRDATHVHHWHQHGYGYAEPVIPAILDFEELVFAFLLLANVSLLGDFYHPLHRTQLDLL